MLICDYERKETILLNILEESEIVLFCSKRKSKITSLIE